jgi:hypothetical protein
MVSVQSSGLTLHCSNGVPGVGRAKVALKWPEIPSLQFLSRSPIHQSTFASSPFACIFSTIPSAAVRELAEVSASEGTTYALPAIRNWTPLSSIQKEDSASGDFSRCETLFMRVSVVKSRMEECGVRARWTT